MEVSSFHPLFISMERKNKKQTIELKCALCQNPFMKDLKEYKRRLRISGKDVFYCGITCRNRVIKTDEFSPFRPFVGLTHRTSQLKHLGFDLDVEYLKTLWEKQKGICPYSKIPMDLPRTWAEKKFRPEVASVDRIDSSKGYVKGNVEFVCLSINYAKNKFSREDFIRFLSKIRHDV